jgi:hypothetical protein
MSYVGHPEYSLPEPQEMYLIPGQMWTTSRALVRIAGMSPTARNLTAHVKNLQAQYVHVDIEIQSVGRGFIAEGYGLTKFRLREDWYPFSGQSVKRDFFGDNTWQAVAVELQNQSGVYAVYHLMRLSPGGAHQGLCIARDARNWIL